MRDICNRLISNSLFLSRKRTGNFILPILPAFCSFVTVHNDFLGRPLPVSRFTVQPSFLSTYQNIVFLSKQPIALWPCFLQLKQRVILFPLWSKFVEDPDAVHLVDLRHRRRQGLVPKSSFFMEQECIQWTMFYVQFFYKNSSTRLSLRSLELQIMTRKLGIYSSTESSVWLLLRYHTVIAALRPPFNLP